MTEIANAFTAATGVEVEYKMCTDDEYWKVKNGGAMDFISSISEFMRDYDPLGVGAKEDWKKSLEVSCSYLGCELVEGNVELILK